MTSPQETRRLFGELNRPDFKTNVRHRAILRKALELFPAADLEVIFNRPIKMRVTMGSAFAINQLGRIHTHYVQNDRLVSRQTPIPDAAARQALRAYRDAYDRYFMKKGNEYRICDAQAKSELQAAEQAWHDWVVPYLAARSTTSCPDWALQPLPGLQRVRIPRARAAEPQAVMGAGRASTSLPTPPPSYPIHSPGSPAHVRFGTRLRPIDLSDNSSKALRAPKTPKKHKFLGVIDIEEEEEEDVLRPRKRQRFLGIVDLTN
ncbi:hypothetical protein B0H13DRAFT_1911506 [Mycena leptocephala]|nr:hypothetical protein B0H13DRAFT_1911506 [Mycena leptocephala]